MFVQSKTYEQSEKNGDDGNSAPTSECENETEIIYASSFLDISSPGVESLQ